MTEDTCCTIVPYFKIPSGKLDSFKILCERIVEKTKSEPCVLYYGFSFDGHEAYCREGFIDTDGLLAHLTNVAELFKQMLDIAELTRLEVHASATQLEKLRAPMASLHPQFFTLEYGFRR